MDQFNKPSKGTDLIRRLRDEPKHKDVSTTISPPKIEESVPDEPVEVSKEQFKGIPSDGVEVVDVKAIEKGHIGIPINPKEKKNFDRIG